MRQCGFNVIHYVLSCNRSITSSKVSPHSMWSECFFQTPASLFSLRASSSFLCLLHLLIASIVPSIMCFRRQSLGKMWLIQLFFPHCSVCRMFHTSLTPYNTSSFFTQLVNWSSAFSNTSFQNCEGISDQFSKMSHFQLSTKLSPNIAFH